MFLSSPGAVFLSGSLNLGNRLVSSCSVALTCRDHGQDHVAATSGEADDGCVVPFALGSLAVVERLGVRGAQRGEGGQESTGDPWLNSVTTVNGWDNPTGSFHPNVYGQQGYEQAFFNFITNRQESGGPLTADGLPADPADSPVAPPPTTLPLSFADLSVTTPGLPADSCPQGYIGGEVVDLSGGGFAPGASVSLDLLDTDASGTATHIHLATVTADADGQVSDAVALPLGMGGVSSPAGGCSLGYFQATGSGASATTNVDNLLFNVATPASTCGTSSLPFAASATLSLSGNDTPFLPVSGAVFEVNGQSLPGPLDGSAPPSPAPGSFAELDTGPSGQVVCPAAEPAGVTCFDGALQDLYAGATYTVTELQAPPGYATAPPETFSAPTDGSIALVPFTDSFLIGNYTTGTGPQNCLLCLMAPTAGAALSASGSSTVAWSSVATVDSSSESAIAATGNAKLSGGALFNPGGAQLTGHAAITTQSPVTSGVVSDPFYWVSFPTEPGTAQPLSLSGSSSFTASPGVYSDITVSGKAQLTLSPGVYVVTGSLTARGQAKVSGTGVTIELACSSYPNSCASTAGLSLSGNATLTLDGGAMGAGSGFVLLGPRDASGCLAVSGNAGLDLTGLVYASGAVLTATGNAMVSVQGEAVMAETSASGNAAIDVTGPTLPSSGGGGEAT
jgi:hypothetical protein